MPEYWLDSNFHPQIPNIDDAISGALITLSMLILNSQCEEGARDGIDIWYKGITRLKLVQKLPKLH